MRSQVEKIITSIENTQISMSSFSVFFFSLIILRLFTEAFLHGFSSASGNFLFFEFTHTFLFFLTSFLIFIWIIKIFIPIEIKKIANVLSWGFLILLTPPTIDYVISNGQGFWSFYIFDSLYGMTQRFFTFFGDNPQMGITYGVRIEVALSLFFIFIYSFTKTKKILKSFLLTLSSYMAFFILGTFPSWITIATRGWIRGFTDINSTDIAQMFLTPANIFSTNNTELIDALNIKMSIIYSLLLFIIIFIFYFHTNKHKLVSFLHNVRLPQIFYHSGLFIFGIGLGIIFTKPILFFSFFNIFSLILLLLSISFAWTASVVFNDVFDQKIDTISNSNRPLAKGIFSLQQYLSIGITLFIVSIFFSAIIDFKIALLLIAYQAIAWMYSAFPLRLKRFAFISTAVSALASLIILFSGFILVAPEQNISRLPSEIIWLLLISFTLSLPIKDFKDIEGDRNDGVFTIPVVFGEYWGKIVVGSGILISYISSVFLLNESRLFWWAILFGGISFWIVNYSSPDSTKKITHRNLPWWIMAPLIFYGAILIKIIFIQY